MPTLYAMKEITQQFIRDLRETIIEGFETFEDDKRFERSRWDYKGGSGGGEMAVLRGDVFEKAAVNFSAVAGERFPADDAVGPFFATGVSLITHMMNPKAPTVHFNIRYIETPKMSWLAGGYDLTPMGFPYSQDTEHFHRVAKDTLDPFDEALYPKYSEWARDYFFVKHRNKERGVGGIFFDHCQLDQLEMWKAVGNTFLDAVMPIYHRRVDEPFTEEDKKTQAKLRAHYVEFNLLYDRGTKFGFQSGGNPEAILCSMPPTASW